MRPPTLRVIPPAARLTVWAKHRIVVGLRGNDLLLNLRQQRFRQRSRHGPCSIARGVEYRAVARRIGSMECVGCGSAAVSERSERTAQGYRRFRCRACSKQFNERSAGSLNRTQYPSDVIALVVLWRLRYKLALRDLPEMFLIRGIVFSHEAVRDWETKLTPAMAESLRRRRRGKAGRSWYVDETYIKVQGHWRYLYRAIDRSGALVDVMFSEHRDMAAAKAFFESAKTVTGITPDRVTTDGHDSYPRAIRTVLGTRVRHRDSQYLNNRLEQDHRGVKRPLRPDARVQVPTIGWRILSCL
jgi:transposase-like protein